LLIVALLAVPALATGSIGPLPLPGPDPTVSAERDTEPVILNGSSFPDWSAPANQTAKAPFTDLSTSCPTGNSDSCNHNHYVQPELDTADTQNKAVAGTPTNRLLGYRWDQAANKFVQIPFQVDEVFTRYLDNQASGFAIYSGEDQHTTYAFDREGFRFTANDPSDPCKAVAASDPASSHPTPGGPETTPDPVPGLDNNDELSFMAGDAGAKAPIGATLPKGVESARAVAITDPLTQRQSYAYVMKAAPTGPSPAYTADSGYVHYQRDANADVFHYSQSNNGSYGQAPKGPYCDAAGNPDTSHGAVAQRRPGDEGTVTTPRYRFRYDGRWLMTDIRISPNSDGNYGPDLVDRWKARAFAQDPGSQTPCCGFEDEDVNWGGSSQLLGELTGPVRAIRETWGADSGTNVIRRETFYRDEVRQKTWLRVHVIPPLDGIYAQWDFNAGRVNRYYNDRTPQGVPIDGHNDETLGNLDDPCNPKYDGNDTGQIDQGYRSLYKQLQLCSVTNNSAAPKQARDHLSIDLADPTLSDANASLGWNETTGPNGTIVDRYQIDKATDLTPGGAAQSLAAMPYYRDDACFDDGTGSDPGPRLRPGEADETTTAPDGTARKCWGSASDPAVPGGDPRYYQGDIGAHGLHLLFQVDSDNARQTVPLDEIVAESRMVMLPGERDAKAGEQYGRGFEKPLVVHTADLPTYNRPPQASFTYSPQNPLSGQTVSFDGSASSDPDLFFSNKNPVDVEQPDSVVQYSWNFGDGATRSGATSSATHAFAHPGTYHVTLTATDSRGGTDSTIHDVIVGNRGPAAAFGFSPAEPTTGDEVSFNAAASNDPDGSLARYEWDLDGDGEFESDGSSSTVSHIYAEPGVYPVQLRVTDDLGAVDVTQHEVTVSDPPLPNQAPTAAFTATPSSPATGDEVSFDASTSSDPDGSIAKYEWDLDGNGSYETDGGTSSDASTSYDTPGTRTVGLRITDDDGATATSSQQVEVVAAEIVPAYDFDLAFDGTHATLSYVANQPVSGRLEVVLRGSAQHRWSTIVRNVRTTSATGDVSLTTGVQHVKQKCRRYRRCVIDVTADVTHLGDSLFHDTDGWSSKR
jgi:PKD repeat protein